MRTPLILSASFLVINFAHAQLVNGGFENWSNMNWEDLDVASTSNGECLRAGLPVNVTKSTDRQNGNYAARLESRVNATDTIFGYFLFGDFHDSVPRGGIPYTQKPTSITGYFKYNIQPGDSAGILVAFMQGGVAVSMDTYYVGGTQSSFVQFNYPLNIPPSAAPDSVVIGGVSSDPFGVATPANGSWIIFDNIAFAGSGITQQVPNTDFETWITASVEEPFGWYTWNLDLYSNSGTSHAVKTTDKYSGSYALQLTSFWFGQNDVVASITNGWSTDSSWAGGVPYNRTTDTLCGYYKYIPQGQDTASVNMEFSKNGSSMGWQGTWLLPAASYTYFEVPFGLGQTPDTVRVDISSSNWPADSSNQGSVLYLDHLEFKSSPLAAGDLSRRAVSSSVFPNPARRHLAIEYSLGVPAATELSVTDISGKVVYRKGAGAAQAGKTRLYLDVSSFASGTYHYRVTSGAALITTGSFIVN